MGNTNKAAPLEITKLPRKQIGDIFSFLRVRDKFMVCQVCKKWNKIGSAPTLWQSHCQEMDEIMKEGEWDENSISNMMTSIHPEIKIKQKYKIMVHLWRQRHNHIDQSWSGEKTQINCCVVGDAGVGKTTFVSRLAWSITAKILFKTLWPLSEEIENCHLQIFDTHSGDQYRDLRPLLYAQMDVIIILFDVSNRSTLHRKWHDEIEAVYSTIPILLVGTKVDLRDKLLLEQGQEEGRIVSTKDGVIAASLMRAKKYWEFSAKIKGDEVKIYRSAVQVVTSHVSHQKDSSHLRPNISRHTQEEEANEEKMKKQNLYQILKTNSERANQFQLEARRSKYNFDITQTEFDPSTPTSGASTPLTVSSEFNETTDAEVLKVARGLPPKT